MPSSDLRPSGVLTIVGRSFSLYSKNFPVMALLSLFQTALPVCLSLALGVDLTDIENYWSMEWIGLLLVELVLALFLNGMLTMVCFLHLAGSQTTFLQVIGQLRGALALRLIGTETLRTIFLIPLFLAFVIPGIVFTVRWSLSIPILVFERRSFSDALRRSSHLVLDHWWRLCGLNVLIVVLALAVFEAGAAARFLGVSQVASDVIASVLNALLYPVIPISLALFYCDMRVRKEGLDVETIREYLELDVDMSEWRYRWDLPTRGEDWANHPHIRIDLRQEDNSTSIDPQ